MRGGAGRDWRPGKLNLRILAGNPAEASPLAGGFDYGRAFETLVLGAVKADIGAVLTSSRAWWPADFGTYAPLFVRMTWHAAGTYRLSDGRGGGGTGQQRFAPLNSWRCGSTRNSTRSAAGSRTTTRRSAARSPGRGSS